MYSAHSVPLFLLVTLAALGLFLAGWLVHSMRSVKAKLRLKEEELVATQQELQERSVALAAAESEMERLRHIPKAELLPMLKLAHEQRSPLAAIQNALDMVLQGYAANEPKLQDEMLNLARDRAATMLERVNDFLRLGSVRHSEIERKVQPVQLLDVLQRLAPEKRVQARSKAVEFGMQIPDSLPVVMATYEDMEHLLSNLINNAIKYTDPGGRVTVSLSEDDGSVVGSVRDTGVGISPQDLPKIFDEFFRSESTKDMAHGTGLGLAIVKRVTDLYGGHLDVESELGKGSTFTFTFPKATAVGGEEQTKTFRDLEVEVVDKGICGKCTGCVSFCSAGEMHALQVDGNGLPRYADQGKCLTCGICYLICPLTRDLDAEVRRRYQWRLPMGAYQTITSARAVEAGIQEGAPDGGIVTALLLYMLENYLIQGAILPYKTDAISCASTIATTRKEIVSAARSHWIPAAQAGEPDSAGTTYPPILSAVKDLEGTQLGCVALVGTPCQIRTIRKMQCLGVMPANVIGYTIGPFCMGHLSFDAGGRQRFEGKLDLDWREIDRLCVMGDLYVSLRDGRALRVPFEEVAELARPTCLACTEYANDYADIAIGEPATSERYATILIRTEKGSRVYNGALGQGYIEEQKLRDASELRSEKTRMLARVVAYARRKRERGEDRLRELGIEDQ